MKSERDNTVTKGRNARVRRVLWVILLLNLVLSVAKIVIGSLTGTGSVRADGIHSIFDSAGNLVGLAGVAIATRPADDDHPYGHSKFEAIASLIIGLMLLVAAAEVGWSAIKALQASEALNSSVSPLSFGIMVATLVANIFATCYERHMGRKLKSDVLCADAKHTLSDALVTISVIVGLVFVRLGFSIADPIATLVVTAAIVIAAFTVFRDVQATFSDVARIDPAKLEACAMRVPGVVQCHEIRTRGLESEVYADLHILVEPEMTIRQAHGIGNEVERLIEEEFPMIREVMVHLEPADPEELQPASHV